RWSNDPAEVDPPVRDITVVDVDDIGGGNGLDVEELAIVVPLDGHQR
ncbi:serine kinase/phosphatase, partial [Pseudomonas syringae pv. tagetis]